MSTDDHTVAPLADEELVRRARAGSSAAFTALVERHQRGLYRFLLLRTGCAADAEDATQEAFVRAWQRLDRYDSRWRFSTWLFTLAARQAVSLHRRERRRAAEDLPDEMDSGELEPGQHSARREQRDNLWDLAARVLNRDQLSALWLRYAEDLAPGEIAAVLGRGASSTRVVLYRARQVLARHLPNPGTAAEARAVTDAPPAALPAAASIPRAS